MKWTVFSIDAPCGAQPRCRIPAGNPVQVFHDGTPRVKYRCIEHADGYPDPSELDAERVAIEEREAIVSQGEAKQDLPFESVTDFMKRRGNGA